MEINVLSGAAVEPALISAAAIFGKRTGNNVKITFATTPEIQAKTKRYVGTDMIEPLINGKGKEIGFMR